MNFLDLTLLPTQKNFRPRKFYLPGNKYGYDSFMSSSISHVASYVASSQRTFTARTSFLLSFLTWESTILTGLTSNVRSSLNWTSSVSNTWLRSAMYLRNWDTWNTLCKLARCGGNAISYAIGSILLLIWYGPINFGVNFLDLIALPMPVVGVTRKNTWSPAWNSSSLILLSAYDFYLL